MSAGRPAELPPAPIRFGTSGWRGVLGEDFTFPRLRRALRGVAAWLADAGGGEVVVAHDTRPLGERMAGQAAAVLCERGLSPLVCPFALPTPAAARAVIRRRAAGAVVFTASHNPPEYHGLKVFGPSGGALGDADARRIERALARAPEGAATGAGRVRRADLRAPYVREVARLLAGGALPGSRLRVVVDAMHGAGAGVLDAVLGQLSVAVELRRGEPDPRFGGGAPDPVPERLRALCRQLKAGRGLRLGVATDGDADRFAAVDADGSVLSSSDAVALLVDHLARTGRVRRGVALSLATGSLPERVARGHGLAVERHPIGFKHLARALAGGAVDAAGEESGGFAWGPFGRDKDGILASCLLAELVATTRAPLSARLAELERRYGRPRCGRIALPADTPARARLARLRERAPRRADGLPVARALARDGLHLALPDGFLMLRASGTEPLLRVYAEAPDTRSLRRRLAAGAALLGLSGVSPGSR